MLNDKNKDTLVVTFSHLQERFKRFALRFLPNEEDAEDALQEAFCKLWPHHDTIYSPKEAEALMTTTVKNVCIDSWRKQQRYQTVEIDPDRDGGITDSLDEQLERDETYAAVERIIRSRLTPIQQEILRRKEFEEDDYEHIAHDLNMQPAAVRVQLSRARKTIREIYQKMEERSK